MSFDTTEDMSDLLDEKWEDPAPAPETTPDPGASNEEPTDAAPDARADAEKAALQARVEELESLKSKQAEQDRLLAEMRGQVSGIRQVQPPSGPQPGPEAVRQMQQEFMRRFTENPVGASMDVATAAAEDVFKKSTANLLRQQTMLQIKAFKADKRADDPRFKAVEKDFDGYIQQIGGPTNLAGQDPSQVDNVLEMFYRAAKGDVFDRIYDNAVKSGKIGKKASREEAPVSPRGVGANPKSITVPQDFMDSIREIDPNGVLTPEEVKDLYIDRMRSPLRDEEGY